MQDYFKYDKIQGGAPLRIKSDSDGVTDGQHSNVPLGIKTTAQGIKHFTNWDDIANSLDAQNKARFDDTQPNALRFSMNNARGAFKEVGGIEGTYPVFRHTGNSANNNPYYQRRQSRVEFEDRWNVEDITILDDMAFVSYPDYTDLHRSDLALQSDDLQLQQLAYFDDLSETQTVHSTLRFTTTLGRLQEVIGLGETTQTAVRSLDFTSLDNTILKIRFTKGADGRLSYNNGANQFSDQPSGDTSTTSTPEVLYFVYGGVLPEAGVPAVTTDHPDVPTGIPYLDETNTRFDRTTVSASSNKSPLRDVNGDVISGENSKQVVGRFYLVPLGDTSNGHKIPSVNTVGIQLDITSRWAEDLLGLGSATLKPNEDHSIFSSISSVHTRWRKQDNSITNKYAAINHGVSTPEDSEYLQSGEFGSTTDTSRLSLGFEDMPVNFSSMTKVSLRIREKCDIEPVACGVKYQIFESNDTTALTNEINKSQSILGEQYFFEDWTDRTLDFTINSSDETSWNGARLRITHYDADGQDTMYFISELELDVEYNIATAAERTANYQARKALFVGNPDLGRGGADSINYRAYSVGTEEVTLIKVQPVRKCGKVDIYTRKKGIIDAVVGNTATSRNHTLNTNDVIEISSALFDGSQAGYADIHPMNGKKFVRKVNDDTFEIFDDQYFLDQTDTSFLRSTMGINWICISSNYGAIGQSWDYHGTVFSPTGRNGYLSGNVGAVENSLSDPTQFFTTKRIDSLFATEPADLTASPVGTRTAGVVNVDFRNSFNNPEFAKIIDESIPDRFSYDSPLSNFQYGPQDFFPYYCSNLTGQPVLGVESDNVKLRESNDISLYTTTPYAGCRFGSSLDIKFSHTDGDSRVYTLAVGERGSDISVDLFGVEESECHIDTYNTDNPQNTIEDQNTIFTYGRAKHCNSIQTTDGPAITENFRKRIVPWYLPYGKTHILAITVDRYGRVSDISHKNTLFGGGDDILNNASSAKVIDHRETNPWKTFEKNERSFYFVEDGDTLDTSPPPVVFERYTKSTTIAETVANDRFIIESRTPTPYIHTPTSENIEETLTDGSDDPFLGIKENRGFDFDNKITLHSISQWGGSRYASNADDSSRGFVESVTISTRLSRGYPFHTAPDLSADHQFNFQIVSADGSTAFTNAFVPIVAADADSSSPLNVQSFVSGDLITDAGKAASLQDWSNAKMKLDFKISICCDVLADQLAATYKIHEFSATLAIAEIPETPPADINTPLPARVHESNTLFDEPDYWLDVNNRYTTKYWLRAAALHWYPQEIYGYNYNMISSDDLVPPSQIPRVRSFNTHSYTARLPNGGEQALPVVRRDVISTQAGNPNVSMSRFGYSGFSSTSTTPEFFDINRFSEGGAGIISSAGDTGPEATSNTVNNNSQWYMFPWVDSFGKSVTVQHTADGTYVLSGCRSRANEEVNAGYQVVAGLNSFPLQPSNFSSPRYSLPTPTELDTNSRIGHINVTLLKNRLWYVIEFDELNSGGTIFTRNFAGGTALESSDIGNSAHASVKYLQLPVGTDAGFGMPEVINSAELSNSHIVWKDGYILFSEQNLYDLKSQLYVFEYNSTTGFKKTDEISVPFIDRTRGALKSLDWPRNVSPAYNVGDGFGLDFRYDKDLLVSNGMQSIDQLGEDITTQMFANSRTVPGQQSENPSRIDALTVYERRFQSGARRLKFTQKIYPSINTGDQERYPPSLITGLQNAPFTTDNNYKYLVPLNTLTYDNVVSDSLVWNMNWTGRYDVIGDKIIIKDPLEYSLYSSTFADRYNNLTPSVSSSNLDLSPYLTFTEHVETKTDSLNSFAKYTYDNTSTFTSSDSCGGGDAWITGRDQSITKTPVMFVNVPLGNLDILNGLTITFDISNQQASTQRWQKYATLSGSESLTVTSLVPKCVLYKKDPRSTIILNGPSDAGSRDVYFPHYENGIFKTIPRPTPDQMVNADSSTYYDTSSNQRGLYNDQHQAFFRGGAADLFFYGTLPASIVSSAQQNITDAMAAGYPDTSSPFYYGGGKNLGEYFDLSYGSHGSTGRPVWLSNDVLDSPFLQDDQLGFSIAGNTTSPLIFSSENLRLIEPYAKLFSPTPGFGDGSGGETSYSITISAADLRDFVIDGNLLKNSTNDRAVFGNRPAGTEYPEIYNDTLASPGYNDVNKASYTALDGMSKTIAIGFVMTNITNHSIGSDSSVEVISTELGNQAFRTIDRGQPDSLNPITGEKRYPYAAVANLYEGDIKTTSAMLDFNFSADISNINISANIKSAEPTRYVNKFHKIAIFDYSQESSDDIKSRTKYNPDDGGVNPDGSIGFSNTQFIEPFARSKFSPLTVGLYNSAHNINNSRFGEYNFNFVGDGSNTSIFNTHYHGVLQSENSIVRFSNTSEAPSNTGVMISSTAVQGSRGSYAKSIQILNSENLSYNDSSYYVDMDDNTPTFIIPPTGHILGKAFFKRSSLLGGFDVYDPEFVPLFLKLNPSTERFEDLFTEGMIPVNHDAILKTTGEDAFTNEIPLRLGPHRPISHDASLYIFAPEFNKAPLFTFEIAPSAVIPLTVSGPDITSDITLVIDPPATGMAPLFTWGPSEAKTTSPPSLFTRGQTDDNLFADLFMPTFEVDNGSPSLYIEHGAPNEAQIPLTFSPGVSGSPPLFIKVPEPAISGIPQYLVAPTPAISDIGLYVDPFGGISSSPTLMTKGPIVFSMDTPFFIGQQGYVKKTSTLYIDTVRPLDNDTPLFTEAFVNTANSNANGAGGRVILSYKDGVLVDGGHTEPEIRKTISKTNNQEMSRLKSNSVIYPTLFDIIGNDSRVRFPASLTHQRVSRTSYMGTYDKSLEYTTNANAAVPSTFDPIYGMRSQQASLSRLIAWYKDYATWYGSPDGGLLSPRTAARDEMFDSNGQYVVVASQGHEFSGSATGGMIAIHKIEPDGSLSFDIQKNTVYFDLYKSATGPAKLGNVPGGKDIVDGFYSERYSLRSQISSLGLNANIGGTMRILDIAISSQNKCAISLRCDFDYTFGFSSINKTPRGIIIEFDILDYIDSEQGFETNQVTSKLWTFNQSNISTSYYMYGATSLSYCGETLYYNFTYLNTSIVNNEYIYSQDLDGEVAQQVRFEPNTVPDAQLYLNHMYRIYSYNKLTGFGYVIKSFDRYETNDKIIFVSAPLFDPYLNNTLTSVYRTNPMGAVYIFIQSLGSTNWTYQGAVYAKGYTSSNITSNLDQYKNGQLQAEFALFGYDLDYKEDVLLVSEPGGNSTGTTNDTSAGRCYRFDVTDPTSPLLLNTYKASDLRSNPVDAASTAIGENDNFGSSVLLLNKEDAITWSDANIQKEITATVAGTMTVFKNDSTLYNLNTGEYFGFQDDAGNNYSSNIFNEVRPYFTQELNEISEDQIIVSSRVLVMKKLKFGNSTKVGVLREFSVKCPLAPEQANIFKIHKLSIIELGKISGLTLFIKGPTSIVSDMPLVNKSIDTASASPTLMLPSPVIDIATGLDPLVPLFISDGQAENLVPLTINTGADIFAPLYHAGERVPLNGDTSLFIAVPNMVSDTSLYTHGVVGHVFTTDLAIRGSVERGVSAFPQLFIGQQVTDQSNSASLYTNVGLVPGASQFIGKTEAFISGNISAPFNPNNEQGGGSSPPLFILGPAEGSVVTDSSLYITTNIPPTAGFDPATGKPLYLDNTNINLVMPVDETLVPITQDNVLFLKQEETKTQNMNLYIERNAAVATTVFVSGVGGVTGIIPLSIESTETSNEDISLFTSPVPAVGINLTSKGFVE